MTALVGYLGVLLALTSSAALVALGVRAARSPDLVPKRLVRPAVWGVVAGAAVAMLALEVALLGDDFSVEYVAEHSARATPLLFKVATAWAALEGSIVLWGLVLAVYTGFVFRQFRTGDRLGAGALAVMGGVAVFFFGMMATFANPFRVLATVPLDGPGPNPLLQNHVLMAIHPPLLYAGYVGFTAPFAFAISALALGERESNWVRRTQRWSLVAWVFLTAGIVGGAWWSYEVLGWGGYWAWDPVENASFLPWLVGTAYLHSAIVQARRGMLSAWSMALVISTFALTILGTFLTRSGVIASVHSFTQSAVGPVLLGFLLVVLIGSFSLFAWRAHLVASAPRLDSLVSREGSFLVNNLLLTLFAFTVLTGTLYPILVEAFTGDQLSVGRPFFDRMAIPLSLALLLAMGLGPVLPWRAARPVVVWARLRTPVRVALAVGAAAVVAGVRSPYVVLVLLVATLITATVGRQLALAAGQARGQHGLAWWRAPLHVMRGDPSWWGGALSHTGVAVLAVGIAASGNLADRAQVRLAEGESARFGGYEVAYVASFTEQEPNREVHGARLEYRRDGKVVRVAEPTLSQFPNMVQTVGTPSVWTNLRGGEDVYASLANIDGDRITVNLFRYPLVFLVWAGGYLVAIGGLFSLAVRRRRRTVRPEGEGASPAAAGEPDRAAPEEPVLEHA